MKKTFSVLVLVLAVAVVFASCGNGGDSSTSSGAAPAKYSTPTAAAASASSAGVAAATVSDLAASMNVIGEVPLPASLAPRLSAKAGLTKAGKTDPQVKALFDKVGSKSRAALQKALKTTKALKAIRSNTIDNQIVTCGTPTLGGGDMTINGTNNYDNAARTYDESSYTITFNACSDGVTEINGSLSLRGKFYLDNTSVAVSEKMTNLTFADSSSGDTVTLNASFGVNMSAPDANHFNETLSANGYFADRAAAGAEVRFTFSDVSQKITGAYDTSTGQETDKMTMNGGMRFSLKDNVGTLVLAYSITATNFSDKVLFLNDVDDTMQEWINGTIALSWTPVLGDCAPGSVTFTTVEPVTFVPFTASDPVSGKVKVNSATIEFATPSGTQITVTLANGDSMIFADMAEFNAAGSSCSL